MDGSQDINTLVPTKHLFIIVQICSKFIIVQILLLKRFTMDRVENKTTQITILLKFWSLPIYFGQYLKCVKIIKNVIIIIFKYVLTENTQDNFLCVGK